MEVYSTSVRLDILSSIVVVFVAIGVASMVASYSGDCSYYDCTCYCYLVLLIVLLLLLLRVLLLLLCSPIGLVAFAVANS
jgi:hypothetical protein